MIEAATFIKKDSAKREQFLNAAAQGDCKTVQSFLFDAAPGLVVAVLQTAKKAEQVAVVQLILASRKAKHLRIGEWHMALHWAAQRGETVLVQLIFERKFPDLKEGVVQGAMQEAWQYGHPQTAEVLQGELRDLQFYQAAVKGKSTKIKEHFSADLDPKIWEKTLSDAEEWMRFLLLGMVQEKLIEAARRDDVPNTAKLALLIAPQGNLFLQDQDLWQQVRFSAGKEVTKMFDSMVRGSKLETIPEEE